MWISLLPPFQPVDIEKNIICVSMVSLMSFTYKPKKRKRKTTHGFLVRTQTPGGRKTLARRRRKGRAKLAV